MRTSRDGGRSHSIHVFRRITKIETFFSKNKVFSPRPSKGNISDWVGRNRTINVWGVMWLVVLLVEANFLGM